jgi:hypothetical protein
MKKQKILAFDMHYDYNKNTSHIPSSSPSEEMNLKSPHRRHPGGHRCSFGQHQACADRMIAECLRPYRPNPLALIYSCFPLGSQRPFSGRPEQEAPCCPLVEARGCDGPRGGSVHISEGRQNPCRGGA